MISTTIYIYIYIYLYILYTYIYIYPYICRYGTIWCVCMLHRIYFALWIYWHFVLYLTGNKKTIFCDRHTYIHTYIYIYIHTYIYIIYIYVYTHIGTLYDIVIYQNWIYLALQVIPGSSTDLWNAKQAWQSPGVFTGHLEPQSIAPSSPHHPPNEDIDPEKKSCASP